MCSPSWALLVDRISAITGMKKRFAGKRSDLGKSLCADVSPSQTPGLGV